MASAHPASKGRAPDLKRLKVLFLATRDWCNPATTGGDNTMWENARYLASVGHTVTFVAAGFPGAARAEMLDGIHVVRLGGIHSLWLTTFFRYMRSWRGKFDVVVAEGFGGSRVPRLSPLYVTEPIITEWHQIHRELFAIQYPRLMNGPLNLLERLTARVHRNTLVRAGTGEVRRQFIVLGFKPEKVFVLPVSIRDEWLAFTPFFRTGRGRSEPTTILWLGKLRRYKCPDHAVRAMPEVVRHAPNAKLILAIRRDDEKYEEQLRTLVNELRMGDHVEFRINVSEQEKRDLFLTATALVVTSAVEGFGIVVLEANAFGVPVVASSGVPEGAVRDGFNGLRYEFGNVQGLSDALVRLLQDPDVYSKISANALTGVQRYKWSRVGAEFEQVVVAAAAHRELADVAND
jgi:glycosyltransferase involved in cell wall biosynthesis